MKRIAIHHLKAKRGKGARIRICYTAKEGAQPQEREIPFKFQIDDDARKNIRWYLEEYLSYPWGIWQVRARATERLMAKLGEELFSAVFGHKETQALYAHVSDDLGKTRFAVHADNPIGIAIPWELMRDSSKKEYGDIARLAYAFIRSQPDLSFQPPEIKGDTFNILLVISRPAGPDKDVAFQTVARPLLERFRMHRDRIRVDVLRPPTFEQLARVLSEKPNFYHVLHFDGHGTFPGGTGSTRFYVSGGVEGKLIFEDEDGGPTEVSGIELGKLLAGKGVPVVILNACQSGMACPDNPYPSIGNHLLESGASGVVAMAYSVYVQTAVSFMTRLYERLIDGDELSRAVTIARKHLHDNPERLSPIGKIPLQDWMVPILFESSPASLVSKPVNELHLDPNIIDDQRNVSKVEIGCPPPPVHGFIGRDNVILELERTFRKETVVLLQGMAGLGKTEAAVGFARWWSETGGLGGPIFYFKFEHHLPLARVCDQVGEVFNPDIKEQLNAEWHLLNPEQRRRLAISILKQVPCLLIWDNFEPVAGFPKGAASDWTQEEQDELRDFLQSIHGGKTKVLITSRREEKWLGKVYRLVELGPLKGSEAHELAVKVMEHAGLKPAELKRLPDYTDLLKYLAGNPLAIQVILPELKRNAPEPLLAKLKSGEASIRDDAELGRAHSLVASLSYRLDSLDPDLRKRLGILAPFQGFVNSGTLSIISNSKGAPKIIRGLKQKDWESLLETAVEVGLLRERTKEMYTIHPAIPWFFHDLMNKTFKNRSDRLERTFTSTYAIVSSGLFTFFKTNAHLAMTHLSLEESNLSHALRLALKNEQWNDTPGILYGLSILFTTQGRWAEWERYISEIETGLVDRNGDPKPGRELLWRAILGHLQEIAGYHRDFIRQEMILLRLKMQYEKIGDEKNQATSLSQLGGIALKCRKYIEAESWYRKSLIIKEHIRDEHGQANTFHQLGMIAFERQKFDEAKSWFHKSLDIKERIHDEQGQANSIHHLGVIAEESGMLDDAEIWYSKSIEIKERIGDENGLAATFHHLGRIALVRGKFDEAESWSRKSIVITERIHNEHGQSITLILLGLIAHDRGKFDEAESWYYKSLEIKERINDEYGQASSLYHLGGVAEERGNILEAIQFYMRAKSIMINLDDPYTLQIVNESLERVRKALCKGKKKGKKRNLPK